MPEYVADGNVDFSLGQDAWKHPDKIRPDQYSRGVNVSPSKGTLRPRNGFHEETLHFEDTLITTEYGYLRSIENIFISGKFQALVPVLLPPYNYLFVVISGLIYKINTTTKEATVLSTTLRLNQYASRINWSYGGDYIIFFDFPDYPLITDGLELFRANPKNEIDGILQPQVPISCLGTYNQNRLIVADAGSNFTAGDPTGNLATPEAPITFTEVFTPNSSFYLQQFTLPTDDAAKLPITAMGFIQSLDNSTGIGPLFVATSQSVFYYNTDQVRANWAPQGSPEAFGRLLLNNAGIAGARAFVNVNSDIVFYSGDGFVHSLSTARNDANKWGNIPISREVQPYLPAADRFLRSHTIIGYHQNRIIVSANPYRISALDISQRPINDVAFAGMVVIELESLSSLLSQGTPVWGGLWTGVDVLDIATTEDGSCYMMAKDGGRNGLFFLDTEKTYDVIQGRKRRVKSIVYTKEYSFDNEFLYKKEHNVTLQVNSLEGSVDLKVERKPSHAPNFLLVGDWHHEAPVECCQMPGDELLNGIASQTFRQLIFGDSKEQGCNAITQEDYLVFRALQLRITVEADYWELENFRIKALSMPINENMEEVCRPYPIGYIGAECEPDWTLPERV